MIEWRSFSLGAAAALIVVCMAMFVFPLETQEEKHTRMVKELEYILPVLRALKGGAECE
jgi:hypothetical protein